MWHAGHSIISAIISNSRSVNEGPESRVSATRPNNYRAPLTSDADNQPKDPWPTWSHPLTTGRIGTAHSASLLCESELDRLSITCTPMGLSSFPLIPGYSIYLVAIIGYSGYLWTWEFIMALKRHKYTATNGYCLACLYGAGIPF